MVLIVEEFTAQTGAAVVAGWPGSTSVLESVCKGSAAEVAFVVGALEAKAWSGKDDKAVFTPFEGTLAFRGKRWKGSAALETMFQRNVDFRYLIFD